MNETITIKKKLKRRMVLSILYSRIRSDMDALGELIDLTENYLKEEAGRLEKRITEELEKLPSDEEKKYALDWYVDDFDSLDKVYPNLQRRALFITLMCMAEANLLLACRICRSAFEIGKAFEKKGGDRAIAQALSYLQEHLTIRDRQLKPYWGYLQNLWSLRNAFVHNDGILKPKEIASVSEFCAPILTLEIDGRNRIILKEGSVQMALHGVKEFFTRLTDEIERNR